MEKQEELEAAQSYGFALFQGYFFEKPQIVRSEDVAPSVMSLLDICIIINKNPDDIDTLAKVISERRVSALQGDCQRKHFSENQDKQNLKSSTSCCLFGGSGT
ncbi:hypothetical protein P4S70_16400 [Enterovibrio sp. Hal110]